MILQSLNEYYIEQVAAAHPDYAPSGMELKRIHFVLVLSGNGQLKDIDQPKGKICVAKSRHRGGRYASLIANRMWDSVGYATGYGADEKLQAAACVQHRSFVDLVKELHRKNPLNRSFSAVSAFYSLYFEQLTNHPLWQTIISKTGHNISFRLFNETLLAAQQTEIVAMKSYDNWGKCMVSGCQSTIARLHPKVYVHGGAPTGTKLVSFTKGCGYDSYSKQGGENAPISETVADNYSAALTGLLQRDSGNCVVVSHVSFLFFTLPNTPFSQLFRTLLDPSIKTNRDELLKQVSDYAYSEASELEFILIAIVPNAVRLSVRLFLRTTIGDVCRNILRFYAEVALEYHFDLTYTIPLLLPLFTASPQSSIDKMPPQLIVDYLYAVVTNTKFPVPLQIELLNRLRDFRKENLGIVSMLRCYLNRSINPENHIPMSLDRENKNTGYLLGRMFAILERTQEISAPGISFTLKDTYYTTASVTPSAVFNRLIGLSNSFFRRIPKLGTSIYMKAQLGEITEKLDSSGIPVRLSLDDQSRFALGYFHQRQIYFTKKTINEEQDN